jgi:UDP-3-O-[3-hydroxymyristoyl] glucosamine N-acyltransferase
MQAKLGELASLVEGQLIGDGELMIRGAAPLCDAEPGEIALLDRAENSRDLAACRASAIVAPEGFEPEAISAIRVADTHAAFARIVCFFRPPRVAPRSGISPAAHVSPSARIADDVEIHPFATIGDNVEIAARGSWLAQRSDPARRSFPMSFCMRIPPSARIVSFTPP